LVVIVAGAVDHEAPAAGVSAAARPARRRRLAAGGIGGVALGLVRQWLRGHVLGRLDWLFCRWPLVCLGHAKMPGSGLAAGGLPYGPGGSAADPGAAAAAGRAAGLGRGCVGLRAGDQRMAARPPGRPAGGLSSAVPGAGGCGSGVFRGAGQCRCPVGAAPLFRRLVRRRRLPQERG